MNIKEQQKQVEDLKKQIESIRHNNPKEAKRLCQRLLSLAEDIHDDIAFCYAEYHLTILYANENDPLSVLDYIARTRQLCMQIPGTDYFQIRLYNLEGIAYIRRGELQQALQCFLLAISQAEATEDSEVLMRLWISVAGLFLSLNQYQLAQQYVELAQNYLNKLPMDAHRAFSQSVLDIDTASIFMNTGRSKEALELLNKQFPTESEMSDLLVSVLCLKAGSEKNDGNQEKSFEIMDKLMELPVSTNLSIGTLMEAWEISLVYAIEASDKKRADKALATISAVYKDSTSLDNKLTFAKLRVKYYREFGSEKDLLNAYKDFYDYTTCFKEQEDKQTADALMTQINLSKVQRQMEKAQREGMRMQSLSAKDELTGLANRRGWREHLHNSIEEAKSHKGTIGLVLLDLDHFKEYNDQFGHLVGDKVLCMAAQSLSQDTDNFFPGRYGGDEFILIFREQSSSEVEAMLKRVFAYLDQAQKTKEFEALPHITFSAGYIITKASEVEQESTLIEEADQILYESKRKGRNRYAGTTKNIKSTKSQEAHLIS